MNHDRAGQATFLTAAADDVNDLERSERAIAAERDYTEALLGMARDPLLVLNADLRVRTANEAFYRMFKLSPADAEGRRVYELGNRQWAIPRLRALLEDILPRNTAFDNYRITHNFDSLGRRTLRLNARTLRWAGDEPGRILIGIQDVTDLSGVEAARGDTPSTAMRTVPAVDADGSLREWIGKSSDGTDRNQAKGTVHESERRFRQMVDALPAAIYTTDAAGRLTHFNPAAVELSGRTPEIGTDEWCVSWKLYHSDGTPLPHDQCPMAIALKEGRVVRGEELIVERPDGTRLWCTPYPTPLRDATGRIVGGINMLVDITERKQAEQKLRDSEQRFTRFMHHLPGLAWVKDAGGRYVYANDAAQKAFQAPPAGLYGKSDEELFPAETAAQFKAHDREALDTQSSIQTIEALTHADGIVHHSIVNKFAIPGPDGKAAMVGGVAIDITELKEAEDALRQSEATFRALAEASPGLIWRLDHRGRFTYVTPQYLDYFGKTSEEVLGGAWHPLVHPADKPAYLTAVARAQRSRDRFQASARVKDKHGEWRWIESHALPLFGAR